MEEVVIDIHRPTGSHSVLSGKLYFLSQSLLP